jgi:hypothetical protein
VGSFILPSSSSERKPEGRGVLGLKTEGVGMGRTATTETPRRPALAISAFVVCAGLLAVGVRPAVASLVCGTKPEIAAEDGEQQITFDAQVKVDRLRQAPPRTNLRAMVTASRRELRLAYAGVEKPLLDHYLLWITCRTISNDDTLAAAQMFDEYSNLYRLMSEPIDQDPAPAD